MANLYKIMRDQMIAFLVNYKDRLIGVFEQISLNEIGQHSCYIS